MTYQNLNHDYSRHYDAMYERHEDTSDCTCPECKGATETDYCMKCGLHHEECECDTPELITETCEKCFGRGEV